MLVYLTFKKLWIFWIVSGNLKVRLKDESQCSTIVTLGKYSQPTSSWYYYSSSLVYKLNQPKIETVRLIFAGSRQKFSLPKLMFRHFKASFEESETYSDRSKIFQKFIFEPDVIFGGFFKYMFFNSTCFFTFFHPFLSLIY